MKQKWNCLILMTIVVFGAKRGRLASWRTPSQKWSTGVEASCCGRILLQEGHLQQNRWLHEVGKVYGYIEATSQDISQEVKALWQMGLPNGQWPQAYFQTWQNGFRTTKSRYWSGHHKALTSIPIEHFWAELKKCVWTRRPTNLTQLHQICQEEWDKIYPTYCGKLVEGYPKRLTQVEQFKGNAAKY